MKKIQQNNAQNGYQFAAFTLAEVLITLTIIGIIAAITIPNLMQKWHKHEIEVRLKDTYAIINQAVRIAEITSNTDSDDWDYTKRETITKNLWPVFKNATICNGPRNNTFNGHPCVGKSFNSAGYASYFDMNGDEKYFWIYDSIILANGASIGLYINGAYQYAELWVDIDGPSRGPEQLGYDIFYLYLLNKSSDIKLKNPRFGQYDHGSWAGSSNPSYTSAKNGCINDKDPAKCYAYIMKNGWKIPDDYPIKF